MIGAFIFPFKMGIRGPVKITKTTSDRAVGIQGALAIPGHVSLKGEAEGHPLTWPFLEALARLVGSGGSRFPLPASAERLSSPSLARDP